MTRTAKKPPLGFTLVEVLVAMLVLGVGALGILKLSTNAMRANVQAEFFSVAAILAEDLKGRYQLDRAGVAGGGQPWDYADWQNNLKAALPGAEAKVETIACPNPSGVALPHARCHRLSINWSPPGMMGATGAQGFTFTYFFLVPGVAGA